LPISVAQFMRVVTWRPGAHVVCPRTAMVRSGLAAWLRRCCERRSGAARSSSSKNRTIGAAEANTPRFLAAEIPEASMR